MVAAAAPLFGPWTGREAATWMIGGGAFFLLLGMIWTWLAHTNAGLGPTVVGALAVVIIGIGVLVAGVVWFFKSPSKSDARPSVMP